MYGKPDIFTVYKNGEYLGEGTPEELSDKVGLKPQTIVEYSYPSKISQYDTNWEIIRVPEFLPAGSVDVDKIQKLRVEKGYYFRELAERAGVSLHALKGKIYRRSGFRPSEVEALEDLFFLEQGELLK